MNVTIAGGHGKIARILARKLTARGDRVVGMVRNPAHAGDLRADGAEPVVLDLEEASVEEVAGAAGGSDAVIFAAGAGPGSGAARKETVDYAAAVKLMEAAEAAGVSRYVMISAMGTKDPPGGDDVFSVYLRAKARADAALMASGLAWTVVRPGRLSDDPETGRVRIAEDLPRGRIPRADVANLLVAVLDEPATAGKAFDVLSGDTPAAEAVAALVAGDS